MRIVVQDPTGCGLGIAVGLVELGHAVDWVGPRQAFADDTVAGARLCRDLVTRWFGADAAAPDVARCDLLVAVDVFADFLHALPRRIGIGAPMDAADPFGPTRNPLVYPERLRRWLDLVTRAPAVAVVDMSDVAGPREPVFEGLPHAVCCAREGAADDAGAWRPLPFLYNNVLLAIERLHAEHEWLLPAARRTARHDWVFCGTVQHPRYGDRRARAIATAHARWPQLLGHVAISAPFAEVLTILQHTRFCLDLPGAGELCFRVHESLMLGTPLLRLAPGRVALPPGLADVVTDDPLRFVAPAADDVRAAYAAHYAPRAAAEALLCAVAVGAPVPAATLR